MNELSNLWDKYCEAKSESEKEAILKKIYPGITEEGLAIFKRKLPVPGEKDVSEPDEPDKDNILTQEDQERIKRELFSDEEVDKHLSTYILGEGCNNQSQKKNLGELWDDLQEAKTTSEKEAAWRNLLETDDWQLSTKELDFLMGRRDQSQEGDA